jgi:serine/threonine-protein kinase
VSTADEPTDAQSFDLLDAYLRELHAGGRPDRERLVRERPDLAEALDCLESLDLLAGQVPAPGDFHDVATQPAGAAAVGAGPPAAFGKYELLRELGRGGMGVVYLARQTDLDRVVALKMILGSHLATPEQVERFLAEARAAARLRHPSVVQVYEAGEANGQPYFTMQYVEGRGLNDVLARDRPAVETAVRLLIDVARAVAYLHGQGLIHRDLKPANVLVDGDGRPYLTDFGLAKALEGDNHLTSTGAILGTPSYLAPEQAAGSKDVGPRSDVYSLGAILYECLTGRPPFREATPLDTLVQVMEGEPTLPRRLNPALPRELELICLKCLEKPPEARYATAGELADDLQRFLDGEAVEARPQGPWQHLVRWWRREPALVARLGGLALFAVIIQAHYQLTADADPAVHGAVLGVAAAWALVSLVCQRLLTRGWRPGLVRCVWIGFEPFLLAALLTLTGNQTSVLLIVFPLLLAGAGLWFRERLVWFATALAELAFLALACVRPELWKQPHHVVLFMVCLGVLGLVVAHQVQRVRVLSRHYGNRPLP